MTLTRLSPHVVWMPPGPPDRPSLCAVTGERGTVMLDSGASNAHAELFLSELDGLGLPRPKLVALTHWHWDHVFGAAAIGAPVIAGAGTARELVRLAACDWDDSALDVRVATGEEIAFCADNLKLELPAPRQVRIAVADIVFEEGLTLDLGGVTCRLQHVGGDHSADSVVAFIEPDGVLFLSDCLYDDIYAPTRHYTTAKLFPLLDILDTFDADLHVTGHSGQIMDRADFARDCQRMRRIGQIADAHPGDEAAMTAAYWMLNQRAPDEDEMEWIHAFANAPRTEER